MTTISLIPSYMDLEAPAPRLPKGLTELEREHALRLYPKNTSPISLMPSLLPGRPEHLRIPQPIVRSAIPAFSPL
jgi:hypothetical protein